MVGGLYIVIMKRAMFSLPFAEFVSRPGLQKHHCTKSMTFGWYEASPFRPYSCNISAAFTLLNTILKI